MWIMTRKGFISAVEWQRPGHEQDGNVVLRARDRKHLTAILASMPETKGRKVEVTPGSDYRYRAWVTHDEFGRLLVALASEVHYRNFKDEVMRFEGGKKKASRYENALHSIWHTLARLQPGGPYGNGGHGYPAIPKGEPKKRRGFNFGPLVEQLVGDTDMAVDAECVECRHVAPVEEFDFLGGGPVCRDVSACVDRAALAR